MTEIAKNLNKCNLCFHNKLPSVYFIMYKFITNKDPIKETYISGYCKDHYHGTIAEEIKSGARVIIKILTKEQCNKYIVMS